MVKIDITLEPDFHAILNPLHGQSTKPLRLLVGCSGGADSLALTLLCADWIAHNGGVMQAVIIDHGLRAGSAQEAEQTRIWLQHQGVSACVQRIDKPLCGNVLAFARRERLRLLCAAAHEFSADAILLGHHRGDQAETVLDRLARGSHALGLCGMQTYTHYQGQLLLRPLLQQSPIRLRAYVKAHRAPIIDDPSNRDERFRRVQIRHWLWQSPELIDLALDIAERAKHQAGVELAASRKLVHDTVTQPLYGVLCLDRTGWENQPKMVQQRTLGSLLRYLSGRDFPPRRKNIDTVCAWLHQGTSSQVTLNGVRLYRQQNTIWLYSETQKKPLTLAPQQTLQWGAHWLIRNSSTTPITVRTMGRRLWRERMPEFADQAFLGETCPVLCIESNPEVMLCPYFEAEKYVQTTLPAKIGADLSKSGLYFDTIYPIS